MAPLSNSFTDMVNSLNDSVFVETITEPAISVVTASGILDEFYGAAWYYEHGQPT